MLAHQGVDRWAQELEEVLAAYLGAGREPRAKAPARPRRVVLPPLRLPAQPTPLQRVSGPATARRHTLHAPRTGRRSPARTQYACLLGTRPSGVPARPPMTGVRAGIARGEAHPIFG